MILMVEKVAKILLIALALAGGWWGLQKQRDGGKKAWFIYATLVLVFAAAAYKISEMTPPLTDTVTLTALGEKCTEARAAEVFLEGYTVDGKAYTAGESLKIKSGHWFWSGEKYCWRIETDTRQPDGITRSIEVRLPVGWERTLNFAGDIWRGFVQITVGGRTWTVDTYAEGGTLVQAQIGRSQTSVLLLDHLLTLCVYAFALLVMSAVTLVITRRALYAPKSVHAWLNRHSSALIYGGIALVSFVLMVIYADSTSLWADELFMTGEGSKGTVAMATAFKNCLSMIDISPPLYSVLAVLWYQISPYGEAWLLLVSIVPTALAVFVIGRTGEIIFNRSCGILAALLTAFSPTVWGYAAFELRAYGFLVFFSALALYGHVCRTRGGTAKWHVLYSFALLGMGMSHYFGMLACVLFFAGDVLLLLKKRISLHSMLAYTLPGVVCLTWLVLVYRSALQYKTAGQIASWYGVPTFLDILKLLQWLSNDLNITYWLFILASSTAVIAVFSVKNKAVQVGTWEKTFYTSFLTAVIAGTILLLYVYGNCVNRESTMWQSRYFLFLVPFMSLLSSSILGYSTRKTGEAQIEQNIRNAVALFFGFIVALNCLAAAPTCGVAYQNFRGAADWLYTQSNTIFNDDTLIVTVSNVDDGWSDYYITQRGRRDALNVMNQWEAHTLDILQYRTIYVQYAHGELVDSLYEILNTSYELIDQDDTIQVKTYARRAVQ